MQSDFTKTPLMFVLYVDESILTAIKGPRMGPKSGTASSTFLRSKSPAKRGHPQGCPSGKDGQMLSPMLTIVSQMSYGLKGV